MTHWLGHAQVSDVAVVAMSLLPNLEELDLRNHQALGPRGLEALAQGPAGSSLRTLRLANCVAFCKQGVEAVSRLPALSTLEMSYEGTLPLATAPLQAGLLLLFFPLPFFVYSHTITLPAPHPSVFPLFHLFSLLSPPLHTFNLWPLVHFLGACILAGACFFVQTIRSKHVACLAYASSSGCVAALSAVVGRRAFVSRSISSYFKTISRSKFLAFLKQSPPVARRPDSL